MPNGTLTARHRWQIRAVIGVLAVIVFSLVGPFSTYDRFPIAQRFLYWAALVGGSFFPALWLTQLLRNVISGSVIRRDYLAVFALGVILGPVLWWVNRIILGEMLARWGALIEHIVLVWVVCLLPLLVRQVVRIAVEEVPERSAEADSEVQVDVPILLHLSPELRGPIRRVSANERQSLIYTEKGEASLRMRFADALIQLDGASGMQVHRSHWLAFDAIDNVRQDGRRYVAKLKCGGIVPVSPANIDGLLESGVTLKEG